jgi:hypothetical protein
MHPLPVEVDDRVEEIAREWERAYGASVALRQALSGWLSASEAVSGGYLRLRQPPAPHPTRAGEG